MFWWGERVGRFVSEPEEPYPELAHEKERNCDAANSRAQGDFKITQTCVGVMIPIGRECDTGCEVA